MTKIEQAARFSLLRRRPDPEPEGYMVKLKNTRSRVEARKNHIVALVRSRPRRLTELSRELDYTHPQGAFGLLQNMVKEGRLSKSGGYYIVPNTVPDTELSKRPKGREKSQSSGASEGLMRAKTREGQGRAVVSSALNLNGNEKQMLVAIENLARECYWATGDLAVRDGVIVLLQWAKERNAHDNN